MATNLVKFVYVPEAATPQQIAAFNADTIYFIAGTHQIYKGTTLYDGGSSSVAADLLTLREQIGTLPVSASYTDLIDYIDKSIQAGDETVSGLVTTLDNSLAAVAKSGAAADVSVLDTAGNLAATDVEGALAEIVGKINTAGSDAAVTVAKTIGGENDAFVTKYTFSQGGVAITNGEITIAKDLVATNGELVDEDGEGNEGTFIKMTIANGSPFYINVADLIEYNAVSSTTEITLADTNHTISATVGEIAASKIIYRAESGTSGEPGYVAKQTVAQAINALETAASTGVDDKISAAIGALDADIDATAGSVVTGITEVDGVITGVDEIALTAGNVAYGQSSNVGAALDTIGTIPSTSQATTVVGYVDEKVGAGVGSLNADVDAALAGTETDTEAIAAVSGITEVAGVITAVDSIAADKAGAATRAKAAVIGTNADDKTASTIYGAKAYADDAVNTAVSALDADLDAALTVADTDPNAVAVVTGVTQVDGAITAIDSVAVDQAGAATAAETAAKAYADTLLTWGSLPVSGE